MNIPFGQPNRGIGYIFVAIQALIGFLSLSTANGGLKIELWSIIAYY
jgi:hypothetical protein